MQTIIRQTKAPRLKEEGEKGKNHHLAKPIFAKTTRNTDKSSNGSSITQLAVTSKRPK